MSNYKPKFNKALERIEENLIYNIVNSLYQLYFHQNANGEELKEYYGWERDFEESERESLVNDTVKRLEQEQKMYVYFVENKYKFTKQYEEKDPQGDLNLPVQRSTGTDSK